MDQPISTKATESTAGSWASRLVGRTESKQREALSTIVSGDRRREVVERPREEEEEEEEERRPMYRQHTSIQPDDSMSTQRAEGQIGKKVGFSPQLRQEHAIEERRDSRQSYQEDQYAGRLQREDGRNPYPTANIGRSSPSGPSSLLQREDGFADPIRREDDRTIGRYDPRQRANDRQSGQLLGRERPNYTRSVDTGEDDIDPRRTFIAGQRPPSDIQAGPLLGSRSDQTRRAAFADESSRRPDMSVRRGWAEEISRPEDRLIERGGSRMMREEYSEPPHMIMTSTIPQHRAPVMGPFKNQKTNLIAWSVMKMLVRIYKANTSIRAPGEAEGGNILEIEKAKVSRFILFSTGFANHVMEYAKSNGGKSETYVTEKLVIPFFEAFSTEASAYCSRIPTSIERNEPSYDHIAMQNIRNLHLLFSAAYENFFPRKFNYAGLPMRVMISLANGFLKCMFGQLFAIGQDGELEYKSLFESIATDVGQFSSLSFQSYSQGTMQDGKGYVISLFAARMISMLCKTAIVCRTYFSELFVNLNASTAYQQELDVLYANGMM